MTAREAYEILVRENLTSLIFSGDEQIKSTRRGVAPLLDCLDSGRDFSAFSAADKVIGNGAAFIYVLLGIREIYAGVVSSSAFATLRENGINIEYESLVPSIKNREGNGFCPIESCVSGITDPNEALAAIRKKLSSFNA